MLNPTDDLPPSIGNPPTPDGENPEVTRDAIHKYVWARYVDYGPAPFVLDEEKALAQLESHYKENPLGKDAECFYYGILAYEFSFAAPTEQRDSYLRRAVEALTAYRDQTGGLDWSPAIDRLEDARELLGQSPLPP